MRYSIRKEKNRFGNTVKVRIIDSETGQTVFTKNVDEYSGSRKQKVGAMNREAEAELARLNESVVTKEEERQAGLEEDVEKFEERITEAGRIREDLAESIQARQQGQLLSQLQRSILGTGGDISQVSALTPQVQEAGQRSLQDYLAQSQALTQQQLAEFVPKEISAETNLANLEDAMRRFTMGEETRRAQIQAGLDQEPEWWESLVQNYVGGGAETGAALLPYLASSASDINVKENISQVGMLDNGLPVYLFNYKGDTTPQIGLMAQDVEKVNKDAVTEIDGVKHVYYTKAVK
jgi:predicted  nucleic acid-binding Zn-ribbon protein